MGYLEFYLNSQFLDNGDSKTYGDADKLSINSILEKLPIESSY